MSFRYVGTCGELRRSPCAADTARILVLDSLASLGRVKEVDLNVAVRRSFVLSGPSCASKSSLRNFLWSTSVSLCNVHGFHSSLQM